MCDTIFGFGQSGNHFFQCPSRRDCVRLPKKLQRLLTSHQIQQVHHVTLGYEDSYLITWRDKSGEDHIEAQGLPETLTTIVFTTTPQKALQLKIPSIRLTLGPYNTSFFLHDTTTYHWKNLPPALLTALQPLITTPNGPWHDPPRLLALGADENFVLITTNHVAVWQLDRYASLQRRLSAQAQNGGFKEVGNVVLHAYRYQCYVLQYGAGVLAFENVPGHEVGGLKGMVGPVREDSREEVERMKRVVERQERRWYMGSAGLSVGRQEMLRREWGERKQAVRLEARGLRMSLKIGVSAGGISAGGISAGGISAGGISRMLGNG